ncbi:MAG: prepilin-type N-terminal cleavage/methylation domain-containing protein [Firmicutes bacterium]|nr:prepilin-type N-terminal cleavage/methylation domain-containing protein [Bacillota bacterium]
MFLKRTSKRDGFSLIELTIVIAVCALFLAMAVPAMHNYLAQCRLEAACLRLQQDIRSTAQDALVKESAYYNVCLYPTLEKYRVTDISKPGTSREVVLPDGVDLVGTTYDDNYNTIYFTATGLPVSGGHISLKSESTGKFMYVIITPVTGRTRVGDEPPDWR